MHYSMVCRTHEVENCEYSIKVSAGLDLYVVLDRSRSKTKLPNLPSARIASTPLLCLCQHLKRSKRRAGRHHVDPIVLILSAHPMAMDQSRPLLSRRCSVCILFLLDPNFLRRSACLR